MASRITEAEREAIVFGLKNGIHPLVIAERVGRNVRRVYEIRAQMQFAETNQSKTDWKEKLKHDFKRIFKKDES